ncbi:DNA-binding transcriptional activator FeaR [Escherichia coli]|nr:DNA-binding transcriptional activator FeaR [Escherichia coli]
MAFPNQSGMRKFTGRLLTERYTGVLDTHFAKGLKLSTVTTSGVNLSRTWQEVKGSDDAWFYHRFFSLVVRQ